jgi:rhodanese-related sulfurtransferase
MIAAEPAVLLTLTQKVMLARILPLLLLLPFGVLSCQSSASSTPAEAATEAIYEDIGAAAFAAKMEGSNTVLLDVRTPGEIARGKIAGATEMDFNAADFAQQLAKLDKNKTYLVYCASGVRSSNTCKMMQQQGFQECYNLIGGYNRWPNK